MKKLLTTLAVLFALSPLSAQAVNVTVPSSPGLGSVLYGKANGNYTTLTIGANGDCLKVSGGLPAWGSCGAGGGGGTDGNWSFFNGSGIRLATTSNQVLIGASSTTTRSALEVIGGIFANASSTINAGLTVLRSTSTNATSTSLAITSLTSELLKVNAVGSVLEAVAGTDYEVPLTFGDGLTRTANDVDVDTTQNIAILSNLTSNGFVKTSGGNGTLSVDTTTYESGLTAGDGLTRTANDFDCDTASGSVFGCLTSTDWNTFNSKQAAGDYITALTGDGTASGPGSVPFTLATVNSNVGSFTNANVTVNAKGLVTAVSSGSGGSGGGNVATSAPETAGQLTYFTSTNGTPATIAGTPTTTVSCSGDASCTPFTVIGSSPITINSTGGAGGSWATTSETYYWSQFRDWSIVNGALSPTTTRGVGVYSSSTISRLTVTSGTTTNATSTNLNISGTLDVDNLTSALVLAGSSGIFEEYAGTGCTNQVIEDMLPNGAASCASINNSYWSGNDLTVANGGTGLSTFGGVNTILYTTAADILSSESAFTYNPTSNELGSDNAVFIRSTSTNATTTQFAIIGITGSTQCLSVDANGRVFGTGSACGSGGGGSIDGAGLAGMMTSWTDSNTIQATSTIVGATFHGTSTTATSTFANAVRVDNYLSVGPDLYSGTYPELVDTFSPDNYIADFTKDVNDYASVNVTNKNAGANASAIYTLNNNLSGYYPDSDAFHYYGELTYNSSNFNNPIYGATNVPNAVTLNSSDGPVLISSATTSSAGYISLIAGGVATDDLRITSGGNVGIGTSSPAANLSIAGRATQGQQPLLLISSTTAAYATTTRFIIDAQGRVGINPISTNPLNSVFNIFPRPSSGISDDIFRAFNTGGSVTTSINASGGVGMVNLTLTPSSGNTAILINQISNGIGLNFTVPAAVTSDTIRVNKSTKGIMLTFDRFGQMSIGSSTPSAMLSITSSSTASTTLSLNAFSNQTADIFQAWRATNTKAFVIQGNGYVGISSSTPFTGLSIGIGNGSSTHSILVAEHRPATSTAITIDWKMGNTQNIRLGSAATTISFSNFSDGGTLKVLTCNPPTGTAGAVTWGTQVLWSGGTVPTQTTTAQKCDVWSFIATQATSTLKIFGTHSPNF